MHTTPTRPRAPACAYSYTHAHARTRAPGVGLLESTPRHRRRRRGVQAPDLPPLPRVDLHTHTHTHTHKLSFSRTQGRVRAHARITGYVFLPLGGRGELARVRRLAAAGPAGALRAGRGGGDSASHGMVDDGDTRAAMACPDRGLARTASGAAREGVTAGVRLYALAQTRLDVCECLCVCVRAHAHARVDRVGVRGVLRARVRRASRAPHSMTRGSSRGQCVRGLVRAACLRGCCCRMAAGKASLPALTRRARAGARAGVVA